MLPSVTPVETSPKPTSLFDDLNDRGPYQEKRFQPRNAPWGPRDLILIQLDPATHGRWTPSSVLMTCASVRQTPARVDSVSVSTVAAHYRDSSIWPPGLHCPWWLSGVLIRTVSCAVDRIARICLPGLARNQPEVRTQHVRAPAVERSQRCRRFARQHASAERLDPP